MKRSAIQNHRVMQLPNTNSKLIFDYQDQKKFLRNKWVGQLEIRVINKVPYDSTNSTDQSFVLDLDATALGADHYDPSAIDPVVASVAEVLDYFRLVLSASATPIPSDLEVTILREVGIVMHRPEISTSYQEAKERIARNKIALEEKIAAAARQEQAAQIANRKTYNADRVRSALIKLEVDEIYPLTVTASRGLDYELPKERLKARIENLFNLDDNLLHGPLFKASKSGEWSNLVRRVLGDGFHAKLSNVESDLDAFYLKILDQARDAEAAGQTIDAELYHRLIRENFPLEQVLDLLEREKTAALDLLERFRTVKDRSFYQSGLFLATLNNALSFDGGLIVATDNSVPHFELNYTVGASTAEFEAALKVMAEDFSRYLINNHPYLRVISNANETVSNGTEVVQIIPSSTATDGKIISFGKVKIVYGYDSSAKVHWTHVPSAIQSEVPYDFEVKSKTLRRVRTILEVYGSPQVAAGAIFSQACDRAKTAAIDQTLSKDCELINSFHPYLEQQVAFEKNYFELLRQRFQALYGASSEQSASVPVPVSTPASDLPATNLKNFTR